MIEVIDKTVSGHSICIGLCLQSGSVTDIDQHPIGVVVSSSCCWRRNLSIETSQSWVSSVKWALEIGRVGAGLEVNAWSSVLKKSVFFSLSVSKVHALSTQSFRFYDVEISTKSEVKCMITLQNLNKDMSSVKFVGSWSPRMAIAVCKAIVRRLGRMT